MMTNHRISTILLHNQRAWRHVRPPVYLRQQFIATCDSWGLPDMSGDQAAAWLRDRPQHCQTLLRILAPEARRRRVTLSASVWLRRGVLYGRLLVSCRWAPHIRNVDVIAELELSETHTLILYVEGR